MEVITTQHGKLPTEPTCTVERSDGKITTNYHPRELLHYWELTEEQQEWFDYDSAEQGLYFVYRGQTYALADFMLFLSSERPPQYKEPVRDVMGWLEYSYWEAYLVTSVWDALLVKYVEQDMDTMVVVGHQVW